MTEVSVPRDMRWLPREMTIQYRKKAETDLRAVAWLDAPIASGDAHDVVVPVDVIDEAGETVVHADITMYIAPKRRSGASTAVAH